MQDWFAVFSGHPDSARDLAAQLEARNVQWFVDDEPAPISTPDGRLSHRSVVFVAPEEVALARTVVEQWRAQNGAQTDALARRLVRVLGVSLLAPAAWGAGYLLAPEWFPAPSLEALGVVGLASLVLVAQVEHRRHEREHIAMPSNQR